MIYQRQNETSKTWKRTRAYAVFIFSTQVPVLHKRDTLHVHMLLLEGILRLRPSPHNNKNNTAAAAAALNIKGKNVIVFHMETRERELWPAQMWTIYYITYYTYITYLLHTSHIELLGSCWININSGGGLLRRSSRTSWPERVAKRNIIRLRIQMDENIIHRGEKGN